MTRRSSLLAMTLLALAGCGDATSGGRASFEVHVGGVERDARAPMTFDNDQGWRVTLTDARIAVGPIYLNTLTPVVARRTLGDRVSDLFVRSAWADGALHLGAGRIVGQVTTQVVVDLLDPALQTLPGGGDGVLERVHSLEFWYFNDPAIQGAAVRVAGVAEKGEQRVNFDGALEINEALATPQRPLEVARRVRGVPGDFELTDGGSLTVRVDPRGWFRGADFSELLARPASPEGVRTFDPTDNVGRAFIENARGVQGVFLPSFSAAPPSPR